VEVHTDNVLAILINEILCTAGSDVRGDREKAKVGQNMFHLVGSPSPIAFTITEFAGQIPADPGGIVNQSASMSSSRVAVARVSRQLLTFSIWSY
jgi:hypothetical protein